MTLELISLQEKTNLKKRNELNLEQKILLYQEAINHNNKTTVDNIYKDICKLYPAMNFMHIWFKKYYYLYDTQEDFSSDYLRIFCTALKTWKPKHLRRESRFGGSGHFKNYFWGCLQNNYINMVKAENSGKRSISSKCPICEIWCTSLSTHLMQNHDDLLWDNIKRMGFNLSTMLRCPFCQNYKFSGKKLEQVDHAILTKRLKRHILSMHSNYLFEEFKNQYPNCNNFSSKPTSVNVGNKDEDNNELSLYDIAEKDSKIENLYASGLSYIQERIINSIFNGKNEEMAVSYDYKLYNCSIEEFNQELEDLKTKLFLCGIENHDEREID